MYDLITGRDLSEKALVSAIELSENKYGSASGPLGQVAEMSYEYQIISETGGKE